MFIYRKEAFADKLHMTNELMTNIRKDLFALADEEYKKFHQGLIPTVNPDRIIGVRTPVLRKYAKDIMKRSDIKPFLDALPHDYYDEDNLHAFIIEQIKDYDSVIAELDRFLPYVDNWATCDMMSPAVFKKNLMRLDLQIRVWLRSEHVYVVRFAIGMLMKHFLGDNFKDEYAELVISVQSSEYYINMMQAWYFATALATQYDKIISIIEQKRLPDWVHNKAIQKAIESSRITLEQKQYLRLLKV